MVKYSKKPKIPTKSCKARKVSVQFKHPQPVEDAVLQHFRVMDRLSAITNQLELEFAGLRGELQRLTTTIRRLEGLITKLEAKTNRGLDRVRKLEARTKKKTCPLDGHTIKKDDI